MFKCEFCDKELKSKAGLVRHGKMKHPDVYDQDAYNKKSFNDPDCITEEWDEEEEETKVVELELCSDDNDYYQGHPRRLIKLEGMLTRTTDENERIKIIKLILELRNENS
jgi:hypothetical protein